MDNKQRKEALEILATLTPRELRVLKYQVSVVHKCEESAMLSCCGAQRCNACYIAHIKEVHGQHALDFYNKLSLARTLTYKEVKYKQQQQEKKTRRPAVVEAVIFVPEALSDEELDNMLEVVQQAIRNRRANQL